MTAEEAGWRRLSPAAAIHFVWTGLVDALRQGWQGLAGLAAASVAGEAASLLIPLGIGLAGLLLAGGLARYWFFRFRLGEDRFEVKKGVFKRSSLSLAFARVQNVAIEQPLYFRPFGLVTLKLESAGSSVEEVDLAGIARPFAERSLQSIMSRRGEAGDSPDRAESGGSSEPLLRQPLRELVRHGVSSNNVWFTAALFASAFASAEDEIRSLLGGPLERAVDAAYSGGPWLDASVTLAVAVGILAFFAVLSVLSSIVLFFNYRLDRTPGGLRRKAGLFETREAALTDSKVQCVVAERSPIALLLGRRDLEVVQVGGPAAQQPRQRARRFLVPSADAAFEATLLGELYPDLTPQDFEPKTIHPAYVRRNTLYAGLAGAAAALALALLAGPIGILALVAPVLAWPIFALRRRRRRYGMAGGYARVGRGFLGRRETTFPLYKLQAVALIQSPYQRRKALADLSIHLAGRRLKIPFMPLEDARAWRDRLLFEAERSREPWM